MSSQTIPTQQAEQNGITPRFLSIAQFMSMTTLSRPTVCRRLKDGSLPFIKIGGKVLIPTTFVDHLLAQANGRGVQS